MGLKVSITAAVAAVALLAGVPASANPATGPMSGAEKLRRLDIMLMVTALRCRSGADDFEADFHRFEANHMLELNAAATTLSGELGGGRPSRHGADALDRISVSIANEYGGGHPWLGCHELRGVAAELADAPGEEPLLAAADTLLVGDGERVALSRR